MSDKTLSRLPELLPAVLSETQKKLYAARPEDVSNIQQPCISMENLEYPKVGTHACCFICFEAEQTN